MMERDLAEAYQLVIAAPGFRIGVHCDEMEIHGLTYLEPGAEVPPQNALAAEAGRQLCAYLADPGFVFGLPLRPSGTAFQRRVWEQIAAIPGRQTRSYGEVARALHNAPRAVGQACGANPFPLVVPCHRVIASGGGLGGFARQRGGFLLDVKRWLLAHEGH
jgi:methylated-DNA-[protein]-cysteine S-methyltransferase